MYDKGGWVFWMLLNQMGRDRALAGMQAFIKDIPRQSRSPGAPGLPGRDAALRRRPGRV